MNSQWIKDINVGPEDLNLLLEKIRKTLEHVVLDNNFLNRPPIAQQIRERIDKWFCRKLKSFCTFTRLKRQTLDWGKFCLLHIDQGINNQDVQGAQKAKLPEYQ
jgi:hypothetical protein